MAAAATTRSRSRSRQRGRVDGDVAARAARPRRARVRARKPATKPGVILSADDDELVPMLMRLPQKKIQVANAKNGIRIGNE